jgi:Fibronectin type III domain
MTTATTTPAPAAPVQPTYDSGLRYRSGARYVGDPTLPVNDGGVIKFAPSVMNATDQIKFGINENAAIDGNPLYPSPTPSVADMAAGLATAQADQAALELARTAWRNAASTAEASMANLTGMLKLRASYVQTASNGNTDAIISAGFLVRGAPVPVGNLGAPMNLNLTLNGTAGMMYLDWTPVLNARAYNIQVSPADTMDRVWQPIRTSTTVRQMFENMELGKTYAFRVAAVGGASGQSPWSVEVVRMAA